MIKNLYSVYCVMMVAVMFVLSAPAMATGVYAIFGNDIIHQPGQPPMIDEFKVEKNFSTLGYCNEALAAHRGNVVKYAETDANGLWINAPTATKFTRVVNATCQNVK